MTVPSLALGTLLALLIGALTHLWRGGNLGQLLLYVILSLVGFWLGHTLAGILGWQFGQLGPLNLGLAVPLAVLFAGLGGWLGNPRPEVDA